MFMPISSQGFLSYTRKKTWYTQSEIERFVEPSRDEKTCAVYKKGKPYRLTQTMITKKSFSDNVEENPSDSAPEHNGDSDDSNDYDSFRTVDCRRPVANASR